MAISSIGAPETTPKSLVRGLKDIVIGEEQRFYKLLYEIGQILKTIQGDLRRITVTQTPPKGHQLKLVWKKLGSKLVVIWYQRNERPVGWGCKIHGLHLQRDHHHHHHHHVVPLARTTLTLSRHFSLSFITSGRSSGLHPVSSHNCCMYVRAGRSAFAWTYAGVHRSTSLTSPSLLLQQCPACLVHLTCIVFVTGDRWPYSWCLVGCCRQDLFNIARNILV